MNPCIIGIDIGTGSIKAVAVNSEGKPVTMSQISYPSYSPVKGYHEQDAEQIWQAFINCTKNIISKLAVSPRAISLSSAMHSLIMVNEDGMPLAPMQTWADSRSGDIAKAIRQQPVGERIYYNTGTPVYSMSPLFKIIWLRENNPELFLETHKFISIKEYIWHKLFQEYQVDYSIASSAGLFNIGKHCWDKEALALAGITADKLSIPVNTNYKREDMVSSSAKLLGIPENTPIVIGASDGCMANLGTLAVTPGIAALTIGTSGAIRVASSKPVLNYETMPFNYILDEQTFICGGAINNGGIALQWLLKSFLNRAITQQDYTQAFEEIDAVPAGSNGLIFLPYLTGERSPIWDTKSCGTFFGINTNHTQAFFARAVLEGICFSLNEILTVIEQSSDKITQINVSGGFVASKTWMTMLADLTGKRICLLQAEDASAIGAAYMAMRSLNLIKDYTGIKMQFHEVIDPDMVKHTIYKKNFSVYKQLYTNLKSTMHQLHNLNH